MGLGDKKRPRGLDKSLMALILRLTKDDGMMVSNIGNTKNIGFLSLKLTRYVEELKRGFHRIFLKSCRTCSALKYHGKRSEMGRSDSEVA